MQRLWKILISPRQEFDEMKEEVPILLPLLTVLLVAGVCGAILIMLSPDEVFNAQLEAQAEAFEELGQSDLAQNARDQIDDPNALSMARTMGAIGQLIGAPISLAISLLILGTFYWIVGKIVRTDAGWDDWFGFSCWVSIPIAVGSILGLVLGAVGVMEWANGAVLAWFGISSGWAMAITIPSLWTLYITINGLNSWLDKGVVTSVIVALIPLVVSMLLMSMMMNLLQMVGLG